LNFWKFVRSVEMLKFRIPDVAAPNLALSSDHDRHSEYYPDVVFLFNKQDDEKFSDQNIATLRQSLNRFFAESKLKGKAVVTMNGTSSDESCNFLLLPTNEEKMEHIYCDSYQSCIENFKYQILGMPKKPFSRPISERDWLKNVGRLWDLIKKSPFVADYSHTSNRMGLY